MAWTKEEVTSFRQALSLDVADFAKAVGVEPRTVSRWETGAARPTGPAEAVLNALREKIRQSPGSKSKVIAMLAGAVALGGLSYLIFKLLDLAISDEGE